MAIAGSIALEELSRCFEGAIPTMLATWSADGIPNLISLSHMCRVDENHVAISNQFFRKTRANLERNPQATAVVMDPATYGHYRLVLRLDHEETSGPLFDEMATRLDAIAAMTGMVGVFRLRSSLVFEVLSIEQRHGVLEPEANASPQATLSAIDEMTQLRVLRRISDELRLARNPESLLDSILQVLDEGLGFDHSMILLLDETGARLYAVASRGYSESGVGAEVRMGEGIIGTVAERRRLVRVSHVENQLRYSRAMRSDDEARRGEIAKPGLPDAQSLLALPLLVRDELVGVLAVESRDWVAYNDHDEEFLEVVASQAALGLYSLMHAPDDELQAPAPSRPARLPSAARREFLFYPADDCVFVDGQYLIRNLPGRILWKLLRAHADGRTEFSNRELRLDASLQLPPLRDNLESRLILLRKRLAEKCPEVRLVPSGRGRFTLDVRCQVSLSESK